MATLTAGTVSSSVSLGTIGNDFQVYVYNDGPSEAHVQLGTTATASSPRVLPGCFIPLTAPAGSTSSLAGITLTGTAALRTYSPGVGIIG